MMDFKIDQDGKYTMLELKQWCTLRGAMLDKKGNFRPLGVHDAIEGMEDGLTIDKLKDWHEKKCHPDNCVMQ